MEKCIVNEEQITRAIANAINEALEDEGFVNKIGNGIRGAVDKASRAYGGLRNFGNELRKTWNTGIAASRAKALETPHPIEKYRQKYGDEFVNQMNYVMGHDANGKSNYAREQLLRTLNANNVAPEDQKEILKSYGFAPQESQPQGGENNIEPQAISKKQPKTQQSQVNQTPQTQYNGVTKQQINAARQLAKTSQMGNGERNAILAALAEFERNHQLRESLLREVVENTVKKYLNEVGDTVNGHKKK